MSMSEEETNCSTDSFIESSEYEESEDPSESEESQQSEKSSEEENESKERNELQKDDTIVTLDEIIKSYRANLQLSTWINEAVFGVEKARAMEIDKEKKILRPLEEYMKYCQQRELDKIRFENLKKVDERKSEKTQENEKQIGKSYNVFTLGVE